LTIEGLLAAVPLALLCWAVLASVAVGLGL
jgi:hypothetical protein